MSGGSLKPKSKDVSPTTRNDCQRSPRLRSFHITNTITYKINAVSPSSRYLIMAKFLACQTLKRYSGGFL